MVLPNDDRNEDMISKTEFERHIWQRGRRKNCKSGRFWTLMEHTSIHLRI